MKQCPHCGFKNKKDAKFCVNCGYHFTAAHKCPNCGKTVNPKSKFCPYCGHKLMGAGNAKTVNNHTSNVYHDVSNQDYSTDEVDRGQRFADVDKTKNVHRNWLKRTFAASFLLFWIKGNISVNYRGVRINRPNSVLGLIPAGSNIVNVPLSQISSAEINEQYRIGRFVAGVLLALFGFAMMGDNALLGLIFVLMGVAVFANGLVTQLAIEQTSGVARYLDVPIYNRQDIELARSAINQALNSQEDKSDLSMYFNKK